ncbi:MAG: hypothetical protein JO368_01910, partial [Acidimicrobiales bacterium]|nr:hypothetical protein [Acidimicrobiales bacterium]
RQHGLTGAGFKFISPPHNLVLSVIATAGVLGLLGLIVIVATTFARYLANPRTDPLSLGVLSATLGVWASFWFVNPGWDRWLWLPLAVVVAQCGAVSRRTPVEEEPLRGAPS